LRSVGRRDNGLPICADALKHPGNKSCHFLCDLGLGQPHPRRTCSCGFVGGSGAIATGVPAARLHGGHAACFAEITSSVDRKFERRHLVHGSGDPTAIPANRGKQTEPQRGVWDPRSLAVCVVLDARARSRVGNKLAWPSNHLLPRRLFRAVVLLHRSPRHGRRTATLVSANHRCSEAIRGAERAGGSARAIVDGAASLRSMGRPPPYGTEVGCSRN